MQTFCCPEHHEHRPTTLHLCLGWQQCAAMWHGVGTAALLHCLRIKGLTHRSVGRTTETASKENRVLRPGDTQAAISVSSNLQLPFFHGVDHGIPRIVNDELR
jgi:hypothetical protein